MKVVSSGQRSIVSLLLSTMLLVLTVSAKAQQAKKIPRIGYLSGGSAGFNVTRELFRQGLLELGYVEGKSILVEYRYAEGQFDRLPDFAAELVQLKVDLIIAIGDPAILAATHATKTIPIVFVVASDPVGDGLVTSLAKPGGNATGSSNLYPELSAKRLELFKEAFPKILRLAALSGPRGVSIYEGAGACSSEFRDSAHIPCGAKTRRC